MPLQDLTPPPTPAPNRSMTNDEFIAAADATVAWWATFMSEMTTLTAQLEVTAALIAAAPAYADPGLVALTGLTPAADRLPYFSGGSTSALATFTAFGRSLVDDADAASARTTLGVGLQTLGPVNIGSGTTLSAATHARKHLVCTAGGFTITFPSSGFTAGDCVALTNPSGSSVTLSFPGGGDGSTSFPTGASAIYISDGAGFWREFCRHETLDTSQLVPAGAVQPFARNTAPTGWLECNGAAVSRTTYAALFTAISTTFGTGDGSTTFNLPDLRGEFIRGWDHGKGTDSGRSFGSSQADELKAHTHTIAAGAGGVALESGAGNTGSTFNTGSTGGTETRPRNVALMYAIKT